MYSPSTYPVQITSNIVRFPSNAYAVESARRERAHSDNVVAFVDAGQDTLSQVRAMEYGKLFSAHRIVSRVADELDATATL